MARALNSGYSSWILSHAPLPRSRSKKQLEIAHNNCIFPHLNCAASAGPSQSLTPQARKSTKRITRVPRRLVSVSTSDACWQGQWSCEFMPTLHELCLDDLAEDGQQDAHVHIGLSVQKHAGFGFSINGRIQTSFDRRCSSCFSSYCTEIDTTFDVWILPSSQNDERIPGISSGDPSVIYVKPGKEADLDSLIQDTIRLATLAKDTCSDSCGSSTTTWQCTHGGKEYDRTWHKLLELKRTMGNG